MGSLGPNETITGAKAVKQALEDRLDSGAGGGGINPNIVNAKGDVIAGTGDNTVTNVPVGVNGQVLSSDDATVSGLRWITISGGGSSGVSSVNSRTGDVLLTKSDVSLSNVDNTSDAGKPVSVAAQASLDLKADSTLLTAHVSSTTNPHAVTKAQVGLGNVDNTADSAKPISTAAQSALNAKADTSALTSHTSNTLNPHSVTKAQVGLSNADNTADIDKPVSSATQTSLNAKANSIHSHAAVDVLDFSEAVDDRVATLLTAGTNVTITYDDVNNKVTVASTAGGGSGTAATTTYTPTGNIAAANVQAAITELDTEKAPTSHVHAQADVTGLSSSLTAKADASALTAHTSNVSNPHTVTKAQVGLGSADNTSDASKPVSTATQTALNAKADTSALTAHTGNVSNPHAVTKAQVGLGSVDNTSDVSKPVSTATQAALDLKVATTAALLLSPTAIQVASTDGTITWLRGEVPYSSGDTNLDQWQFYARNPANTAWIKTTWLNGNYEFRCAPSLPARVGFRAFEMAESAGLGASNGNFFEASTNPNNAANREALLAVRGTATATLPGWVTVSRGIDAPNIKPSAWVTVTYGAATAPTTTYETPASRLESNGTTDGKGRVSLKGRIEIPINTASGATLFTIADATHRPAKVRGFAVRTGGGNLATIMEINAAGQASLIVASGASASWLYLDGISLGL